MYGAAVGLPCHISERTADEDRDKNYIGIGGCRIIGQPGRVYEQE